MQPPVNNIPVNNPYDLVDQNQTVPVQQVPSAPQGNIGTPMPTNKPEEDMFEKILK